MIRRAKKWHLKEFSEVVLKVSCLFNNKKIKSEVAFEVSSVINDNIGI
jgi:uncharacterized protein YggL (DUF469 family)